MVGENSLFLKQFPIQKRHEKSRHDGLMAKEKIDTDYSPIEHLTFEGQLCVEII
jgi:hypothetical protein